MLRNIKKTLNCFRVFFGQSNSAQKTKTLGPVARSMVSANQH